MVFYIFEWCQKAKKKANESIKRELLNSLQENDNVEKKRLTKQPTMSTTLKKQYISFIATRALLKHKMKKQ